MRAATLVAIALSAGYLAGAIPWGLWIGRAFRGIDVREHGSRNLGATNVYRVLGPPLGLLTLVLDIAKGALPVAWLPGLPALAGFPGGPAWCAVAVGFGAVAGHVWTCFAGFRGGKGVATTVGVLLALAPAAFAWFVAVFAVTVLVSRYVSLASLLGSLAFVIALAVSPQAGVGSPAFLLGLALTVVVFVRHRPNIHRLLRGEEKRFAFRGGEGR